MADRVLDVVITGVPAGEVRLSKTGALSFRYFDGYRGTPLSLSMPVCGRVYPQKAILPYLQGLLPDNEAIRQSIARRYGVGPNNVFVLLSHVGLDCPGGVQLCPPEGFDDMLLREGSYEPLSDEDIGRRLSALSSSNESWVGGTEHWSLGGNQSKIALAWHQGHWCSCLGAAPTTHILKTGVTGFRFEALDEYFCMRLAEACGLPVAKVDYRTFAGVPAIIVERYDRSVADDGVVSRIHQEDLCQALGYAPDKKYTADGGPNTAQILDLLAKTPQAGTNARLFSGYLFYNCLIAATDAHAKNYSILLDGSDGAVLAPLYDVASGLPYDSLRRDGRLAMSIGGENRIGRMSDKAIARYARSGRLDRFGVDENWCSETMAELAGRIEHSTPRVFDECMDVPGMPELRGRLEEPLLANCHSIAGMI